MVQTRSAAKKIKSGDAPTNELVLQGDTNVEPVPGAPSPKKPRREVTKKRRRGTPGELCQLNLDVLFLIAAYIHPIDLLNLARTCKSLRELLMDKSSTFVWRTAFQQVRGLPACPADLTEPEYANLVFCDRCHGCGKYTTTIFWNVRRRYCPGCRIRCLRCLSSCNETIRKHNVLAVEHIMVKKQQSIWVEREQAAAFMHEYRQSSDKAQYISDKQKQRSVILQHANICEAWQKRRDLKRKEEQKNRQRERGQSIFRHLRQLGYSHEMAYFGYSSIQRSRDSDFKTSKLLTNKEWERLQPEWIRIMDNFRSRRLETAVYGPRRHTLESVYNRYVRHPSSDAPTFDLLPHLTSLVRFIPFRDIIKGPEENRVNNQSFEHAFAQLPALVSEWKEKLDAELAELIKIPLRLSPRASVPNGATQRPNSDSDKLHLACALFQSADTGVFAYPEVFFASTRYPRYNEGREDDSDESISDRIGIRFLEEAPYIVHACGLDPKVATPDDMDHRNARLKCLSCEGCTLVMSWRRAMWHAYSHHKSAPLPKLQRWQLVSDEYIDAIQTVEKSKKSNDKNDVPSFTRCLFCRPRAGDMRGNQEGIAYHLYECHNMEVKVADVKQGVHYVNIGICDSRSVAVDMVVKGGKVTFIVPPK